MAGLTGTVPATGLIRYGGKDISDAPPRSRRFGNVYQEYRLFPWATTAENVAFPCRAQGLSRVAVSDRVARALKRMDLQDCGQRLARDLSGGQAQRAALARAIAFEPLALFLDEPFSSLDWPLRSRLRQDLAGLITEEHYPTILVTHDRTDAFALCDRIGILFDGELRQIGTPEELLHQPTDRQTAEFLGFSNSLSGTITKRDSERVIFTTDGIVWTAALPSDRGESDFRVGDTISALFRPATLRPLPGGTTRTNACSITVETIHETESHYHITTANSTGDTWSLIWPLDLTPPAPGTQVRCAIDPADILLFPAS